MDSLLQLVIFALVMLFGSYLVGSVPLVMSMSKEKLHLITVMGAGLLVGVAFAVIVPEGMQTLIKAKKQQNNPSNSCEEFEGLDQVVGVSLIMGFLFMLLVEQLAAFKKAKNGVTSGDDSESLLSLHRPNVGSWTTTLGLVVHAAADGIAMGAAAATHHVDVEFIVFLAIMLHKAPAAFGLVSFFLHEGVDRKKVRKHLLAFAFAAPIMAIVTYAFLTMRPISEGAEGEFNTFQTTGVAMLFSAGTFLYVSTVHVLPEVILVGKNHGKSGFSMRELLMLVIGSLLPLLLTLGHQHH